MRLEPNYAGLVSHSRTELKKRNGGIWRNFSVFKGTNVVGKYIMSYFNYASSFRLKHGSN